MSLSTAQLKVAVETALKASVEVDGYTLPAAASARITQLSASLVDALLQGVASGLLRPPAGTAVVDTAPLKFLSGALLAAPEAGAIEFLLDAVYATITTGLTRKTFAFLESPEFTGVLSAPELELDFTSGKGIKFSGNYGWHTIHSVPVARGSKAPTWAVWKTNIWKYRYGSTKRTAHSFRLPHDYAPGTDVYLGVHYSQRTIDTGNGGAPGDVKWEFEATYAKAHDQAAFPANVTPSVVQTASGTQYQLMYAEVQLSSSTPAVDQLDSALLEIDGAIETALTRSSDAADTLDQYVFVHSVVLTYQSTAIPTKGRTPNFYV